MNDAEQNAKSSVSDLWDFKDFKYPALLREPLLFQDKLRRFFDVFDRSGYQVIKADGELINNSWINGIVYLAPGAEVKPFCFIEGRLLLEENSSLGPHAYVRGDVIVGRNSRLGRCEVKHSIIMNEVNIHHHSYVGDSIVGNRVNIAAGFVTANLRFDNETINVKGLGVSPNKKFGSLIGDEVKTMVNASLMPGSLILKGGVVLNDRK